MRGKLKPIPTQDTRGILRVCNNHQLEQVLSKKYTLKTSIKDNHLRGSPIIPNKRKRRIIPC